MCPAASHRKPSVAGSIDHNKTQNHSDLIKIIAHAANLVCPSVKGIFDRIYMWSVIINGRSLSLPCLRNTVCDSSARSEINVINRINRIERTHDDTLHCSNFLALSHVSRNRTSHRPIARAPWQFNSYIFYLIVQMQKVNLRPVGKKNASLIEWLV